MRKMTNTVCGQRNFTSSAVINDTTVLHLLDMIARPLVNKVEHFLHIDTNSTRYLEFVTVTKDGIEIFEDLMTHNFVKVIGDFANDIEQAISDKEL